MQYNDNTERRSRRKRRRNGPVLILFGVLALAAVAVLGITIPAILDDGSGKTAAEDKQPAEERSVDAQELAAVELAPEAAGTVAQPEAPATEAGILPAGASPEEALARVGGSGCVLADESTILLRMNLGGQPATGDAELNVYQLAPYQYELSEGEIVGTAAVSDSPEARFPRAPHDSVDSLYCKYVFATKEGEMLGEPQYIVNPELLATSTKEREGYQPKGLADIFYNYNLDTEEGGDHLILQINNYGSNPTLRHPAGNGTDPYPVDEGPFQYMFNAANAEGVNALAASMHNLADTHITQDYIVGNEVNERKWCYVNYMDWDRYVREYLQGFRVSYNAIKSANANAHVFICLSQDWDRNRTPGEPEYYAYIDAKDFVLKFNAMIKAAGDVDWGLSYHPHPVPLTHARFWDMTGMDPIYSIMINTNAMVSFQNLSVLTDFMMAPELLSPTGRVRHMMASETGLSAGQGEEVQAAALYASYQACIRNPYIETMIYSPDPSINAVFLAKTQEVYDNMGGPADPEYDAWAKSVIGIDDWSRVLR
ncbi:MAG: hypothetical protein K6E50_00455 [Lachnospiraceae bacterium]|nr:hypothetical protein [Lachnospiraceae bacterium]